MKFSSDAILLVVAGLASTASAVPQRGGCRDLITCVDGVNSCGMTYGGCYNTCSPEQSPVPPTCKPSTSQKPPTVTASTSSAQSTSKASSSKPTSITSTTSAPPSSITTFTTKKPTSTSDDCVHMTQCEDYFDACGNTYGGCWDICTAQPTWSTPYCTLGF